MLGNGFSIRHAIAFGWTKSLEHLRLLIKVALTCVAVQIVLVIGLLPIAVLLYITRESYFSLVPIVLGIIYALAASLFLIGMMRLGLIRLLLDIYERNRSEISRLFSAFNLVFTYIVAAFLFSLILVAPGIVTSIALFVLPRVLVGLFTIVLFFASIVFLVRFGFYIYPIVDKGMGAVDALKKSWEITEGSVIRIILFELVLSLIPVALGSIVAATLASIVQLLSNGWYAAALMPALILIGVLFVLALIFPMVLLANVYVYKKLSDQADKRDRVSSVAPREHSESERF